MLPEAKYPIYELNLPSTQEIVTCRPFKVKENKVLLQSLELGDSGNFIETIYSIVEACTFNKIEVRKLPMEDIDFLFLKIKSKSIGETIDATYKCVNPINDDGDLCNTQIKVKLNLNDIQTYYPIDYERNRIIMVNEDSGIKLRSPTFEAFKKLSQVDSVDSIFNITDTYIFSCVECIFDGDNVQVPGIDFTEEDFKKWIDDLDSGVIDEINNFFETMPYTGLEVNIKCPKCKTQEKIILKELDDFFV